MRYFPVNQHQKVPCFKPKAGPFCRTPRRAVPDGERPRVTESPAATGAKLNELETDILVGAVADLHELQNTEMPGGWGEGELKIAVGNARDGHVRSRPFDWTGGPTDDATFRVYVSRAYKRLEARGLIKRLPGPSGRCTTQIAPTKAGIALAKELGKRSRR